MASSNNLAAIDPWMFRSADSWYTDAFARETESALTKALQQSLFSTQQQSDINHPFLVTQSDYNNYYCSTTASASTITASGSGSEPETPGSKRRALGVSIGKLPAAKRKSRASKRSMTTFIQADPANFRQMVQQVTGVKLEGGNNSNGQLGVVKPEPLRRQPFMNKLQGLLPTLDTSAYLLHRTPVSTVTQKQEGKGMNDLYSLSSFPTLESSF